MHDHIDLGGVWQAEIPGLGTCPVHLPGTLDQSGAGLPDTPDLTTRLTRTHTFEGAARFRRSVAFPAADGERLFLMAERSRQVQVFANGKPRRPYASGTLSTPWVYEVSDLAGQTTDLTLVCDNSYADWDRDSIIGSSAVTDETQTNWNGVIGQFSLYREPQSFIRRVRVYPFAGLKAARVAADLDLGVATGTLQISSEAFVAPLVRDVSDLAGRTTVLWDNVPLRPGLRYWDEEDGVLYDLQAFLDDGPAYTDRFGVRSFGVNDQYRLTLNGRAFFLRGEANCAVFPQSGCPPMDKESWLTVLRRYASYGVNCMRFHSWCPPDAAFAAADELGMMMQPELSHWNCKNAFASDAAFAYYRDELTEILYQYANHPSFVMLSLGNELMADEAGHRRMDELLATARAIDTTRLYANGSNTHYGALGPDAASDFYTSMAIGDKHLRATSSPMVGHLNECYPDARHNYTEAVNEVLQTGKPVFGFEVGQYEVLPDFAQIDAYRGVTRARNLELVRETQRAAGRLDNWDAAVQATGELALRCYREEVEAVLRTPGMSGLSLLGLQDFPGQGTALVGMMDANLVPKPYDFARPERFRAFFTSVLPLVLLERYTYTAGEVLCARVQLANYGKSDLEAQPQWRLCRDGRVLLEGSLPCRRFARGGLREAGELRVMLDVKNVPARLDLEVTIGTARNAWPLWIYPTLPDRSSEAEHTLTEALLHDIENGARVLLEPPADEKHLPRSIPGQFSTDFWSVHTFPTQPGGMGLCIDAAHPALADFPTEGHADWQWWAPSKGRPLILPAGVRSIAAVPDVLTGTRNMGLLFEARVGKGAVLVSSMGLSGSPYPECRALLSSLLDYVHSDAFAPTQTINAKDLRALIPDCEE